MNVRPSLRPLLAVALLALASTASAQDATLVAPRTEIAARLAPDSTAQSLGPTRSAAAVAVRPAEDLSRTPAPAPARSGFTHGEALMIVGGAAILTGIVIGNNAGHAISVAGAVVGLIGLYQYLQ